LQDRQALLSWLSHRACAVSGFWNASAGGSNALQTLLSQLGVHVPGATAVVWGPPGGSRDMIMSPDLVMQQVVGLLCVTGAVSVAPARALPPLPFIQGSLGHVQPMNGAHCHGQKLSVPAPPWQRCCWLR